jgi:hypothetical protein
MLLLLLFLGLALAVFAFALRCGLHLIMALPTSLLLAGLVIGFLVMNKTIPPQTIASGMAFVKGLF